MNVLTKFLTRPEGPGLFMAVGLSGYTALSVVRLYLANRYYLDVDPTTVAATVLIGFVGLATLCAGLLGLSGHPTNATRVLASLLLAFFFYDNLLFFLLPPLDGVARPVVSPAYYAFDGVLLALLLLCNLRLRTFTHSSFLRPLVGFSLLMVALQVAAAALGTPRDRSESVDSPQQSRFALSPRRNVIHLLFDTFQGTELPTLLEAVQRENPLPGFVWYRDTLGVNVTTSLTLPSVFSGHLYDESSMRNFYTGTDRSILDLLEEEEFDQHILTALPMPVPESATVFPARALSDEEIPGVSGLGQLFDLFFIRAGPFLTKNWFLNDYNFRLAGFLSPPASFGNDRYRRALLNFRDGLFVSEDETTRDKYFFLHLIYPHPPFSHEADCGVAPSVQPTSDPQNRVEHLCAFQDFLSLLDRLRDLNVYHRTSIVMHGDTGAGLPVQGLAEPGLPEMVRNGVAFPVLLVKPFDSEGGMRISQAPASIRDIPNLIAGALGRAAEFPGSDLVAAASSRQRRMLNWSVGPDAFSVDSWIPLADSESSSQKDDRPLLGVGDVVSFRGDGVGFHYKDRGWSATKAHGTWALYPSARLVLPFRRESRDPAPTLRFRAWLGGPLDPANVMRYSVNGAPAIPLELEVVSEIQIRFEIPVEVSPSGHEMTLDFFFDRPLNDQISDKRPLGFLVEWMRVE